MNCIIPDTSAVIIGAISEIIETEDIDYPEIIVPEAVVCELEHQANANRSEGIRGLKELQKLQQLQYEGELSISFKGRRPTNYDIKYAKSGEIDSIIRDLARSEMGTLLTNDKVQAETAKAQGIPVYFFKQQYKEKPLSIEKFFDEDTMSIHLKENIVPMAKKGTPGHVNFEVLSEKRYSYKELKKIVDEILDKAKSDPKTYLESEKEGSFVVQSREYRISIAYPPFSEALEITIVRPVANISLDEYNLSEKLLNRIQTSAEGILISGSPGAGKSTFVQAIANYYSSKLNKIVKTMESPRDLQLPDEITQYAPLEGNMENTADVLLLVRPDYTIYDELRKNSDFNIFADMRLAGVGMIGVVHATRPIDAIQRISSRVELGVIPSIVDTSIYIENGKVTSVYETKMTVKVPTGMKEADLARPVIEVRDFETGELKNEIYTYGEQTIVMDMDLVNGTAEGERRKTSVEKIAEKEILRKVRKLLPKKAKVDVEVTSPERANIYIPEEFIPKIIGKNGKRIAEIEENIGISLGVEVIETKPVSKAPIEVDIIHTNKQLILDLGREKGRKNFDVYIAGEYLLTATTSKKGEIKIKKGIELSDFIIEAIEMGLEISAIQKM
ncbi:MAG: PINc/VapC family ATPase [Methanobrevibacter sp.]|uniref:PINc/VapC family ATPase n=1 Tax=Methanobrevibacter TaxID=2172 RepID=UPI0026EA78D4|nr:PINc/VapC family ATPase [Methanobrevibacter gottschalkii]MCI7428792.1 PINc/VapC family ATPase [Methanobrevibacter sp.]MDD6776457.1 PINc/VapC family ATPase [Methanobacteriaceae archaeon]